MKHERTIKYARKAADQYEIVMPMTSENEKRLLAIRQAARNTETLAALENLQAADKRKGKATR